MISVKNSGVGGCMEKLLRTRVGQFSLDQSLKLAEVERTVHEGRTGEIHDADGQCIL